MPALVSAGLIIWLVWRVSPQALAVAAARLDWPALALVFLTLVVGLFLWDTVCLRWLFSEPGLVLSYRRVLQARGRSYLLSALNYELGQGLLAWELASTGATPIAGALARCLLLGFHDVAVLLALGLAASWWVDLPLVGAVRVFCATGLALLIGAGFLATFMPAKWRERFVRGRWRLWPDSWTWSRSLHLCGLRAIYYSMILAAVACGLEVASIPLSRRLVCGVVPLVLLADGLPISVSGLGTRETSLLLLLRPEEPAPLVAFSMIWSSTLVSGRLIIGLAYWWLPPGTSIWTDWRRTEKEDSL